MSLPDVFYLSGSLFFVVFQYLLCFKSYHSDVTIPIASVHYFNVVFSLKSFQSHFRFSLFPRFMLRCRFCMSPLFNTSLEPMVECKKRKDITLQNPFGSFLKGNWRNSSWWLWLQIIYIYIYIFFTRLVKCVILGLGI